MSLLLNKVRASLVKLAFTKSGATREKLLKVAATQKFDSSLGREESDGPKKFRSSEPIGKINEREKKLLDDLGFPYDKDHQKWPEIESHVEFAIKGGQIEELSIVLAVDKAKIKEKVQALYAFYEKLYKKALKEISETTTKIKEDEAELARAGSKEEQEELQEEIDESKKYLETCKNLFAFEKLEQGNLAMFKIYDSVSNFESNRLCAQANDFLNWHSSQMCPHNLGWSQTWDKDNPVWDIANVPVQLEDMENFIAKLDRIPKLAEAQQIDDVIDMVTGIFKRLYPMVERNKGGRLTKDEKIAETMTLGAEGSKVSVASIGANIMNTLFTPPKKASESGEIGFRKKLLMNKKWPKLDNLGHISSVASLNDFLSRWGLSSADFLSIHDLLREKVWKAMKKGEGAIASREILSDFETKSKNYFKDWMNPDLAILNNELTDDIYVVASASINELESDVIRQLGNDIHNELDSVHADDGRFLFKNSMEEGAGKAIRQIVKIINNSILKIVGERDFSIQIKRELDKELEIMKAKFVASANDHFARKPHPDHGVLTFDADQPEVIQDLLRMGYNEKEEYLDPSSRTLKTLSVEQYDEQTREIKLNKKSIEYPSNLKFNAIMDTIYNPNAEFSVSKRLTILRSILGSEEVPSMKWGAKAPDSTFGADYGFHIGAMMQQFEKGLKAELHPIQFVPVKVYHPEQKQELKAPFYIEMTSSEFSGILAPKLVEMVSDFADSVKYNLTEVFDTIINDLKITRRDKGRPADGPLTAQDVELLMNGTYTTIEKHVKYPGTDQEREEDTFTTARIYSVGLLYQKQTSQKSTDAFRILQSTLTRYYTVELHKLFWDKVDKTKASSFLLANDKKTPLVDLTKMRAVDNTPLSWIDVLVKEAGLTASGAFKNNPGELINFIQYAVAGDLLVNSFVNNVNAPYWQANKQKYDKGIPKTMNAALAKGKHFSLNQAQGDDDDGAEMSEVITDLDQLKDLQDRLAQIPEFAEELQNIIDTDATIALLEQEINENDYIQGDLKSLSSQTLRTQSLLTTFHTFDSSLVKFLESASGDSGFITDALAFHLLSSVLNTSKDDLRIFFTLMSKAYKAKQSSASLANLGIGLVYYFTDTLFKGGGTYFRNSAKGGSQDKVNELRPTVKNIDSIVDIIELMLSVSTHHNEKVTLKAVSSAEAPEGTKKKKTTKALSSIEVTRNPVLFMPLHLDANSTQFGHLAVDAGNVPVLAQKEFDAMFSHNEQVAKSILQALQTTQISFACEDKLNFANPEAFLSSWVGTLGEKDAFNAAKYTTVGLSALKSALKSVLSPMAQLSGILSTVKPVINKAMEAEDLAYTFAHNLKVLSDKALEDLAEAQASFEDDLEKLDEMNDYINETMALFDLGMKATADELEKKGLGHFVTTTVNQRGIEVKKVTQPMTDYGHFFLTKEEVKKMEDLKKEVKVLETKLKSGFEQVRKDMETNRKLALSISSSLDHAFIKASSYKNYIFPDFVMTGPTKEKAGEVLHRTLHKFKQEHSVLKSFSETEFTELLALLTANAFKPLAHTEKDLLVLEGNITAFNREGMLLVSNLDDLSTSVKTDKVKIIDIQDKMLDELNLVLKQVKTIQNNIKKKFASEEVKQRLQASLKLKEALVQSFANTKVKTANMVVLANRTRMYNLIKSILTNT